MTDLELDPDDRRLIAALQVRPRASWTELGATLERSPVTLARRWSRLTEAGAGWMTVAPNLQPGTGALGLGVALVELRVPPGQVLPIADELCAVPEVATIDLTAGGRELVLTVIAGDEDSLARLLLERLHPLGVVLSVHAHPVTRTYVDGSSWRLPGLTEGERNRLTPHLAPPNRARISPLLEAVARELARDGRISASELADRLDVRPRRARDLISDVIGTRRLRFRTELARRHSGYPLCTWYFLKTPASQRANVAARIAALQQARAVVAMVGQYDLAVDVWTRTLDDVQRLEATIEERMPGVHITDRSLVLRTVKLMGRLLDESGCAAGFVPLPAYLKGGEI
ncbi:Lrp/AsnC family transcriptional regulator [Intrasporangium sp. DVR]|uniref:Lrp/AsnC family transcriptional regulator n=1 Tax=Intrasporangium sp. DVR TaxID=3127867 RepID=UPI00313A5865